MVLGFAGVAVLLLPGARPSGVCGVAVALVRDELAAVVGRLLRRAPAAGCRPTRWWRRWPRWSAAPSGSASPGCCAGRQLHPSAVGAASWVALGYLVVFGSVAAFTAYSWLLGVAPTSQVATYAYVNPVVAVGLGALVLGEQVDAR